MIKKIFLLMICWLASLAQVTAQHTFEIKSDTVFEMNLGYDYYHLLEDKEGKWTIDQINKAPLFNQFHPRNVASSNIDTVVHTYWFRYYLENKTGNAITIDLDSWAERSEFFVFDTLGEYSHFLNGDIIPWSKRDGIKSNNTIPLKIKANEKLLIYNRIYNRKIGIPSYFKVDILNHEKLLINIITKDDEDFSSVGFAFQSGFLLLATLINLFFFFIVKERVYLYFALWLLVLGYGINPFMTDVLAREYPVIARYLLRGITPPFIFFLLQQFNRHYFQTFRYTPRWDKILIGLNFLYLIFSFPYFNIDSIQDVPWASKVLSILMGLIVISILSTAIIFRKLHRRNFNSFVIAVSPFILLVIFTEFFGLLDLVPSGGINLINTLVVISVAWMVTYFSWVLFGRYDQQRKEIAQKALEVERLAREKEEEKNRYIAQQKVELEKQVLARTTELNQSLIDLKATQSQLIQSEKMASLGELTAGIAHEIQNPLNFVNNFSEVNTELIEEATQEIDKGNTLEAKEILKDIKENESKINHHGKRADAIVKGMLQHSKGSTGQKEQTDINKLCDEYLRLSYHGLRAKDKSFNAKFEIDFDPSLPKINVVRQEIGRVVLNLINNAFYAVHEKANNQQPTTNNESYQPTVSVSTKKDNGKILISVKDNGNGIPEHIKEKIFQPFFTTKPTGQGTGLGLSLSYDIVKAHGGELKVETKKNEGCTFLIKLPLAEN